VFAITKVIWQGPFASPQRALQLSAAGITHILNVGECESVLRAQDGPFVEVAWHPIADFERIPSDVALRCLDALHRMSCSPDSSVYVHCIAGWNRSPTIVWLYLVACGVDCQMAKELIAAQSWDSVPGHPRLVDDDLVHLVAQHGAENYVPHPRPEVLFAILPTGR
jgi:hypothetical protein